MDDNAETEAYWSSKGIVGADMESGAMMTIGRLRGMETLSILNNVVLYEGDLAAGVNSLVDGEELMAKGEIASLKLAMDILSDDSIKQ
jgi:uridine phosphorylase